MADPGAEAIVIGGIDYSDLGSYLLRALDKLSAQPGMNVLARQRREKPGCAMEQISVGGLDSGVLFAGHRMPGKKSLTGVFTEGFGGALNDFTLCATDVGQESLGGKGRTKPLDHVDNR